MTSELFAPKKTGIARWLPWILIAAVLIFAAVFPLIVDRPRFWLPNIGVKSIWLGIIAMSLVFLNRYVGLLSLAQVTIAGVAAYGVGYMMVTLEMDFLLGALVGIIAGTYSSIYVAAPLTEWIDSNMRRAGGVSGAAAVKKRLRAAKA